MRKHVLPALLVMAVLCVPHFVHALTTAEVQAQIQSLTNQLNALKQKQTTTVSSSGTTTTVIAAYCPNIARTLIRGSRGSDVTSLQQFLIAKGFLSSDSATGFFGLATEGAVQRFQAGNGIVKSGDAASTGYGAVGVRTRASIAATCGGISGGQQTLSKCPIFLPIDCTGGTLISLGTDANGCSRGTQCVITTRTTTACMNVTPPTCPGGRTPTQLGYDAAGCNLGYQCPSVVTCGAAPPPSCPAGTLLSLGVDSQGCSLGYRCSTSTTTTTPTSTTTTPALKLSAQIASGVLSAAWQTDNAPSGATVSLFLTPIDGTFPATVASNQSTSGTLFWSIPATYCSGTVCGIPISGQYYLHIDVLSGTQKLLSKDSDSFTLTGH